MTTRNIHMSYIESTLKFLDMDIQDGHLNEADSDIQAFKENMESLLCTSRGARHEFYKFVLEETIPAYERAVNERDISAGRAMPAGCIV